NRDLGRAVSEGRFRADLFYRLNVFPIHIPPLRERAEDIPSLVRHFVMLYAAKMGRKIAAPSQEVLNRLRSYRWPRNVRELQNAIDRAVILASNGRLGLGDFDTTPAARDSMNKSRALEDVEREHIRAVLEETRWRVGGLRGAAKVLGLKRTTLDSRIRRLGLTRPA